MRQEKAEAMRTTKPRRVACAFAKFDSIDGEVAARRQVAEVRKVSEASLGTGLGTARSS